MREKEHPTVLEEMEAPLNNPNSKQNSKLPDERILGETAPQAAWSAALLADASFLGIPMKVQISKQEDTGGLTGSFRLQEAQVLTLLEQLSLAWKEEFIASPLYPLVQGIDCQGILLADTKGHLEAIGESGDFSIGLVRADGKFLLLITVTREGMGTMETAVFSEFLRELQSALGVERLCVGLKSSGQAGFDRLCGMLASLEKGAFETSRFEQVILPDRKELMNARVLASGEVNLSKSSFFFFRALAQLFPEYAGYGEARVSFAAGYGDPSFVLVRLPGMSCTFLLGKNPEILVAGHFSFTIGSAPVTFVVNCRGKSDAFGISGEFESASAPIPVWGPFSLNQLGIVIGMERGGFYFGGYGILQMGKLDLFALVFAGQHAGVMTLPALGLALNRMTLVSLMESVLSVELPGLSDMDFLALEPLPLKARRMDTSVFDDTSEKRLLRIAEQFNGVSRGDCGGRSVSPVSGDKLVVRPCEGGWMMTDKTNIRHYRISAQGEIALVPQMYYCSQENFPAGSYTLYRGVFVCASMVFLGMKVNFFGEMDEKSGFEALVTLSPISLGALTIGRSRHQEKVLSGRFPAAAAGSVMSQYLYDGEGPVFYLCLRKGYFRLYLDASIRLLGILEADAYLTCDAGRFYLYTEIQFFLMRAKLMLSADYGDFSKGSFAFSLVIDLSLFQDVMNQVSRLVRAFVAEAQSRISDAQAKLTYAQNKVMGLTSQIQDLDNRIWAYKRELSGLRWYQFIRAAWLLIAIGGLEIAKAGIYMALGAALAVLEIAKLALEAVKHVTGAVGYLIQKLAEGIASVFFLKEIGFSLGLDMDAGMNAAMYTRFNLFGKEYQLDGKMTLRGDVKGALHGKVSRDVTNKTSEELNHMRLAEWESLETMDCSQLVTGLRAFLEASDFPYNDCDGYRECLSNALTHEDRYAYLYGCMEAAHYCDMNAEDDMTESHRGQIAEELREGKQFWTSCLGIMAHLDCQELLDEVRKETTAHGFASGANEGFLDEMEKKWAQLRSFQDEVREQMSVIEQMDERFLGKTEMYRDRILEARRGGGDRAVRGDGRTGFREKGETADVQIERYLGELFSICTDEKLMGNAADAEITETVVQTGQRITEFHERFHLQDQETFFINPANEPVVDRIFEELCDHSESEQLKELENISKESRSQKESFKHYRIRIPE